MEASEASPPAWSPQDGGEMIHSLAGKLCSRTLWKTRRDEVGTGGLLLTELRWRQMSTLCVQMLKWTDDDVCPAAAVDAAIKEIHQLRLFYYFCLTAARTGGQSFTWQFGYHFIYCPPLTNNSGWLLSGGLYFFFAFFLLRILLDGHVPKSSL